MRPALEVTGLAFAYPDGRQVIFGVDLVIDEGERVATSAPTEQARPPWSCT